jgi:hypothetical protein
LRLGDAVRQQVPGRLTADADRFAQHDLAALGAPDCRAAQRRADLQDRRARGQQALFLAPDGDAVQPGRERSGGVPGEPPGHDQAFSAGRRGGQLVASLRAQGHDVGGPLRERGPDRDGLAHAGVDEPASPDLDRGTGHQGHGGRRAQRRLQGGLVVDQGVEIG